MKRELLRKIAVLLVAVFILGVGLTGCGGGGDDEFPSRPITLVIPFGAGGAHDMHARAIVSTITPFLNDTPMIVELRPGAGGALGGEFVARSNADGYTLLFGNNAVNINLPIAEDIGFGPEDFIPIALINYSPGNAITTAYNGRFADFDEMIAHARANPGDVTFASAGIWGVSHLPFEIIAQMQDVQFTHVPFDGGGPAHMAVLAGEVDFTLSSPSQYADHIAAGNLRALLVLDYERTPHLPDTPTAREVGMELRYVPWRGVFAPAGTPDDVVLFLREAFRQLSEDPTFIQMIENLDEQVLYFDAPDWIPMLESERAFAEAAIAAVLAEMGR